MSNPQVKTSYSYERLCFDRWAAWCEGQWETGLGLPKDTLLSRLGLFGIRMGVVHAGSEPDIHDEPEIVSMLMEEWATREPLAHTALMARHRRIVGSIKVGSRYHAGEWRPMRDRDLALVVVGDGSEVGKRGFQRLCESGYAELRLRIRQTPA